MRGTRQHVDFLYSFPSSGFADFLWDEYELGERVSYALDDENNCKEAWPPCWCIACTPEIYPPKEDK